MLSICSVVFVEVPPINPKNNSFVVPAQADMSSKRLDETLLVGMYIASSENKLFVPKPHTRTSLLGLPDTTKSKAIATALAGTVAWGSARVAAYRIGVVVRDEAGLLDDVAATEPALSLPAGLEVRVLESRGGWHHVRLSSGRDGWLSDRVLDVP